MKEYVLYLRTGPKGFPNAEPTYIVKHRADYERVIGNEMGTDDFTRKIIAESDNRAELERFQQLTQEN